MTIHLSLADISPLEEQYVLAALRSGYVAPMGPHVDEFERRVANRVGAAHAVALSSGTAALHLGLLALGCAPGTEVVLPTLTFAATANAVLYTGARPVFVDSEESDGNLNVDLLIQALDALRTDGRRVAAVISVDLFGRSADYTRLVPILAERGIPLLEDAAEAFGARHQGRAAGSFGTCGALSFNGNKIMTTSGGGMLLTDDEKLASRARYLSTQARQPVPWYEHDSVGYNYRLSNVLAALGLAQLARLDAMIQRRREIRALYRTALGSFDGVRILGCGANETDADDNCWLTTIVLNPAVWSSPISTIISELNNKGIEARHVWKPLHRQPVFADYPSLINGSADTLFRNGINLPSGSQLSDDEVYKVVDALSHTLRRSRSTVNKQHRITT